MHPATAAATRTIGTASRRLVISSPSAPGLSGETASSPSGRWQSPPIHAARVFSRFQALIDALYIHWVNRATVCHYHRSPALCRRKLLHDEGRGVLDVFKSSISAAELGAIRGLSDLLWVPKHCRCFRHD